MPWTVLKLRISRLISVICLFGWMGLIWHFSSIPAMELPGNQMTRDIVSPLVHVFEYTMLGLLLSCTGFFHLLSPSSRQSQAPLTHFWQCFGALGRHSAIPCCPSSHCFTRRYCPLLLLVIFFGGMFAFGDEYHQSFVPGRDMSLIDVFVDLFSLIIGIRLFTGFYKMWYTPSV